MFDTQSEKFGYCKVSGGKSELTAEDGSLTSHVCCGSWHLHSDIRINVQDHLGVVNVLAGTWGHALLCLRVLPSSCFSQVDCEAGSWD